MIRANLLPRPRERVGFGGLDVDAEHARQALLGFTIVALVALVGIAIESFRVGRLEAVAAEQDRAIAAQTTMRARVKTLALDVARYQTFAREARRFRESGADAAIALARIGNSVPDRVWLTSLERQDGGYEVVGAARSVDGLGAAMFALGASTPRTRATLVNIDNRTQTDGVRFTARLTSGDASNGTIAGAPPTP